MLDGLGDLWKVALQRCQQSPPQTPRKNFRLHGPGNTELQLGLRHARLQAAP